MARDVGPELDLLNAALKEHAVVKDPMKTLLNPSFEVRFTPGSFWLVVSIDTYERDSGAPLKGFTTSHGLSDYEWDRFLRDPPRVAHKAFECLKMALEHELQESFFTNGKRFREPTHNVTESFGRVGADPSSGHTSRKA